MMRFFGGLSFDRHGYGAFSLQMPSFHFLFSSSSPQRRVYLSRGHLKLRPGVTSTYRATFIISASECPSPQPGDALSDGEMRGTGSPEIQEASTSSNASSTEGNVSSLRSSLSSSSSSLSGNHSASSGASASVKFTIESLGGNQASASSSSLSSSASWTSVSQTQANFLKITDGALYSTEFSSFEFKKLSHMSKGVKTAFDVVQGWKIIQRLQDSDAVFMSGLGSAGSWILLSASATKFFAKGLKMSQKVLSSSPVSKFIIDRHPDHPIVQKLVYNDLASLVRGFNAFYAAVKIAQFSSSIGNQPQQAGSLPDLGFVWKGFKFSKSLVSLLDVVVGKNGWAVTCVGKSFFIVKKAIGGISVMVKAAFLSKELGPVILRTLAIPGRTIAAIFGAGHQARDPRLPTLVMFQRTKSKGFSSMTLESEEHLFDNEGVFAFCSLVSSLADNLFTKHSKEDDLMTVFCLAIPLQVKQVPVFA